MNQTVMPLLRDAVLDGDVSRAIIEVKNLLNTKVKPEKIIKEARETTALLMKSGLIPPVPEE